MKPPATISIDSFEPAEKPFKVFIVSSATIIILFSVVVPIIWSTGVSSFIGFPFHLDGINPVASFCILLMSISVLFFSFKRKKNTWKLVCKLFAFFVILQGIGRLVELADIYDLKFDMIFFYEKFEKTINGEIKGRMTYIAAIAMILFGIILLLKINGDKNPRITQSLLLVIIVIAIFNIISFIYGVKNEYFGPLAIYKMRLGASLSCFLTALNFLLLDRKRGVMAVIISREPGGKIATVFLPILLLFPILLGVIDRLAETSGLFQDALGLALSSIVIMVIFFIVIIRTARSNNVIYKQLLNEIEEREKAGKEAHASNVFASTIYENIPHMVFVKDGEELRFRSINKAGEELIGHSREEVIGKSDHDFFPKKEADFFRIKDKEVFMQDTPVVVEEAITTEPNGVRWLRTKKIGVRDEKGNPLYMIGISEDITELKEKQEQLNQYNAELEKEIEKRTKELRKSEERYQKMVEDVQDYAILLLDTDGIILNWNKGAEKMKGYKAEEIIGKNFKSFYTYEEQQKGVPANLLAEAKRTGRASNEGWRIRKDGRTFWVVVSITALYDEDGEITGFSKVTRDITERKLAEQKLEESQQQFEAFMGTLPAMAWIVDENGFFHYVNSLYMRVFDQSDLIGKKFDEIFPKEIVDEYLLNNDIVFKSNIVLETTEPSIKPDGSRAILKVFKFPLGNKQGIKLLGGIAVDITQMVETEEALKQANEQINLFVKHTPAAVAMFDKEMRYMVASDRWYRDYNLQGQDIIGQSHYDVFPEINEMSEWKSIHRRSLNGEVIVKEKDPFPRSDGSVDWLRWEIHPWKTKEHKINGIILFTEVITDRIRSEQEMFKLNEQLVVSNRELEQFAYVASHDLQEPLRMVSSFLQLLEKKYKDEMDETAHQYIHFAVDGAERMKTLINDLLKFSRLGNMEEKETIVDCNEIVRHVITVYNNAIDETRAVVNVSSLPVINGRRVQIEQLFQNLIGNALKYRGERSPVIEIGSKENENEYEFFVKDNGIGIDKKYFNKIFVIFQRLHGKNEYGGTGIGLAICKKIVERHGGRISVDSMLGEGTIFYFTLPKNE